VARDAIKLAGNTNQTQNDYKAFAEGILGNPSYSTLSNVFLPSASCILLPNFFHLPNFSPIHSIPYIPSPLHPVTSLHTHTHTAGDILFDEKKYKEAAQHYKAGLRSYEMHYYRRKGPLDMELLGALQLIGCECVLYS
jgi:hypothetical protein